MYRRLLQGIYLTTLLFVFWPVFRFHDVTIFDWLAPFAVLCALPYPSQRGGTSLSAFSLAIAGILIFALAGVLSVGYSYDPYEHVSKVAKLLAAFLGMLGFAYALTSRKILTVTQALIVLFVSASAASIVCILQGKLHILTEVMPKQVISGGIKPWSRMSGLAEGPIEAGLVGAFGATIGLGLGLHKRIWLPVLPIAALNVYSFSESASLTALIAVMLSLGAACWYDKAYRALLTGIVFFIAAALMASALNAQRLTERVTALLHSENNYVTVQTREEQWGKALSLIEPHTLFVGNGFSSVDLPDRLEIHNGIIASVFHFGVLGLLSQGLLIGFFLTRIWARGPRALRATLLGCVVVFTVAYLTTPTLSRRSLWVTPMILGAYLASADGARQGNNRAEGEDGKRKAAGALREASEPA